MNSLVFLALLGAASAAILPPLRQVAETADVVAAKARFFQLYREQAALAEAASDDEVIYHHQPYSGAQVIIHQAAPVEQVVFFSPQYSGAQAIVNSEGLVQNTAEVQNAINAFNAAYQLQLDATRVIQAEAAQHQAAVVHQAEYSGPQATVNSQGLVENTVEVKNAINAFNVAYQAQLDATKAIQAGAVQLQAEVVQQAEYSGPQAMINSEGLVQNTVEVQEAINAFNLAYQAQLDATKDIQSEAVQLQTAVVHQAEYSGPQAMINSEGLVQNTVEVQNAINAFNAAYQLQLEATRVIEAEAFQVIQAEVVQHQAAVVHQTEDVQLQAEVVHQAEYSGPQAMINSEGLVQNTAEVQNAINAFNAAYQLQLDATRVIEAEAFQHQAAVVDQAEYSGPQAMINSEGQVENTVEVKNAINAFNVAYQAQLDATKAIQAEAVQLQAAVVHQAEYSGPKAMINSEGQVENTVEVKNAINAFNLAYQAQLEATRVIQAEAVQLQTAVVHQAEYSGPQAMINSEGLVQNTVEVQKAINAFNIAYQAQLDAIRAIRAEGVQQQATVVHQVEPEHQAEPIEQVSSFSQQYTGPHAKVNAEGLVQNTAEVQKAINAFNAAYQLQLDATRVIEAESFQQETAVVHQAEYAGPQAMINSDGQVENTVEVKNAINAFNVAYQAQLNAIKAIQAEAVQLQAEVVHQVEYSGPHAMINSEGQVENTVEVKNAINAFNLAYQAQLEATSAIQAEAVQLQTAVVQQAEYSGPQAMINSEGLVQNTIEVQKAINAFNIAYQAQLDAIKAIRAEVVHQQASVVHKAEPEHHAEPIEQVSSFSQQYTGPHATVNAEGLVQNTAEVQKAINAFNAAYQLQLDATRVIEAESFQQQTAVVDQAEYSGPQAMINSEGQVENTVEVKNAINAFNVAYQAQLDATKAIQAEAVQLQTAVVQQAEYSGPQAMINSEGLVENTAEVKNAINAFNLAYQAQLDATTAIQAVAVQLQNAVVHQAEYSGPQAMINSEGLVQNTIEVQNAINAFNLAYQAQLDATRVVRTEIVQHQAAVVHKADPEQQAEHIEATASFSQQYTGPHATFNDDGSIKNTAEVEAAAKAFFEAYQAQLALTGAIQEQSVVPSVQVVSSNLKYNGPSAPINADGLVENTAEVQAAALTFFEAYEHQLEATASTETYVEPAQLAVEPIPVSAIVVDESAHQKAWALHLHAFKHALATTGDFTPEATLAKQALLQAYMEVSQRDYE